MKKAELVAVLVAAGFKVVEDDYTVDELKPLVKIVESAATVAEKDAEIAQLNDVVEELTETIENSELKAKVGADVVKIGDKTYAITSPKFTMPGGRKFTAQNVMEDKDLQKEILEGGYAVLEEIAE